MSFQSFHFAASEGSHIVTHLGTWFVCVGSWVRLTHLQSGWKLLPEQTSSSKIEKSPGIGSTSLRIFEPDALALRCYMRQLTNWKDEQGTPY